jgi:hypothetical protein
MEFPLGGGDGLKPLLLTKLKVVVQASEGKNVREETGLGRTLIGVVKVLGQFWLLRISREMV